MAHDDTIKRSTTVRLPLLSPNHYLMPLSIIIFPFLLRNRFASFIEGGSHLMDDEILEYETTQIERDDDLNTDDEDDLMTDSDSDK